MSQNFAVVASFYTNILIYSERISIQLSTLVNFYLFIYCET